MDYVDDQSQAKEVFALYGAAMYEAQCVEKQLAILGATKYNPSSVKINSEDYNTAFRLLLKKTFGAIYKQIQKETTIPIESSEFIEEAVFVRNWLAHDYFWERAGHLPTSEGCEKMLSELHLIHDQLAELDRILTEHSRTWGRAKGITDEIIQQLTDDLISHPDQSWR